MKLDAIVGATGWTENVAKWVLVRLQRALVEAPDRLGPVVRDAQDKAWDTANSIEGLVTEHPVMCTIIALGVLVLIAPRVVEALGFAELGPVEEQNATALAAYLELEGPHLSANSTILTAQPQCTAVCASLNPKTLRHGDFGNRMDLFQFGFGARPETPAQVDGNHRAVLILRANKVKVLWLSWCDAVVAHQDDAALWTVEYKGTGLTSTQHEFITNSHAIRDSISGGLCFFGTGMHEGLLGCVIFRNDRLNIANQVIVFATDLEIEAGIPQVQLYTISNTHEVLDIKIASGGCILVNVRDLVTRDSQILQLEDLQELQQRLKASSLVHAAQSPLGSFQPTQWCTNATTSTALDQSGKLYTSTCDSRYPKCLGRPYDGNPTFELVPYLSETIVSTVASGGYLTAALSSDGELFLWGQNCPGTSGDLSVLNKSMVGQDTHQTESPKTGIWAEGEQDDFVKCMTVYIDGQEARVYDVAVGHGHILVAAEVLSIMKRAVFSAGDNSEHQTGLQTEKRFVAEFTELREFKDAHIQQVVAAGWSTLVLRKDDTPHTEYTQISS